MSDNKITTWISEKEFSFHRIETLIFLLFSSSVLLMTIVIPFAEKFYSKSYFSLIIFIITHGSISGYWYYQRITFPKNKDGRENIVVAIVTENAKQKSRITHDFAKQISRQIHEFGLDNHFNVTVLNNYQSAIMQRMIGNYLSAKRANFNATSDIIQFDKLLERLNARFIIYGDLIERNSENNTYCMQVEALLLHQPTNPENGLAIGRQFSELWKKEVQILEKEELTGFRGNAEHVFFTATYMLGLATLVNNRFVQGINIWESLEKYVSNKIEFEEYGSRIIELKSAVYFLYSRFLYLEGEFEQSMIYRKKFLEIFPNKYDSYLSEAIHLLENKKEPGHALKLIYQASKVAPDNDGTWRYSELYLQLMLNQTDQALNTFDLILNQTYKTELDSIKQVIAYNSQKLVDDAGHIQTYFIIGILLYKKLGEPIEAHENLSKFIEFGITKNNYEPLILRAKTYLKEIDKIIGLSPCSP